MAEGINKTRVSTRVSEDQHSFMSEIAEYYDVSLSVVLLWVINDGLPTVRQRMLDRQDEKQG